VEYVEAHLASVLLKEIHAATESSSSASIRECFESAFLLTDIASSQAGITESGSTGVSVLIRQEGANRVLYAANCGDSRAVLCQNKDSIRLTFVSIRPGATFSVYMLGMVPC
jgi:serine/threonine protein phosphatase PrpC